MHEKNSLWICVWEKYFKNTWVTIAKYKIMLKNNLRTSILFRCILIKAMVQCSQLFVHKISKQIFKSHVTHIMFKMSFFFFFLNKLLECLFFLKHKLENSSIDQTGKIVFTTESLTAANTLSRSVLAIPSTSNFSALI